MTRSEVARAIGRSVATVRRMEGNELNPYVDWQGVHHFDEDEVKAVADELNVSGRRSAEHTQDGPAFMMASRLRSLENENAQLREESLQLRKVQNDFRRADEIGANLLKLANDAILSAEEAGSRQADLLRFRFNLIARTIS